MKLARYWTRQSGEADASGGRRVRVVARGWSNASLEDAAEVARSIARRVAERVAGNRSGADSYLYGDRPLPEPVLREFQNGTDGPSAVITRNSYGAEVMNTREMMFIDIDRAEARPVQAAQSLIAGIASLFGKRPAPETRSGPDDVVTGIQRIAGQHNLAVRIYRTAAGYRALIVSEPFDPLAGPSEDLLRQFGSDPLYIRLCRMQQSFRARLTPKPWRCGMNVPPVSFPFETPQQQAVFQQWEAKYSAAINRFATCHFVAGLDGDIAPRFGELVRYHDRQTKANSDLPLA